MCRASEAPFDRIESAVSDLAGWLAKQEDRQLGIAVIQGRALIDRLEAVNAEATRRFEKSGAYKADGALGWCRGSAKRPGSQAAQRRSTSRSPVNSSSSRRQKRRWRAGTLATSTRSPWPS